MNSLCKKTAILLCDNPVMSYKGIPTNVYVDITARINKDGQIFPLSLIWQDGREFPVDRLLNTVPSVLPQGGEALCFICLIKGKRKELYLRDGKWFVIVDQAFTGCPRL